MKKSAINMFLVFAALLCTLTQSYAGDFSPHDYSLRPKTSSYLTETQTIEVFQLSNFSLGPFKPSIGLTRNPSVTFAENMTFGTLRLLDTSSQNYYPGITRQPSVSFLLADAENSGNIHKILKNLPFIPSVSMSSKNGFNSVGAAIWFDDDGEKFGKILFFGKITFWGY